MRLFGTSESSVSSRGVASAAVRRHEANDMSEWALVYDGFEPDQEGLREALCTLGNGYFATRGAAPEARADEVHYPGTYIAGCYNRLIGEIAERSVENEDLVNTPTGYLCRSESREASGSTSVDSSCSPTARSSTFVMGCSAPRANPRP